MKKLTLLLSFSILLGTAVIANPKPVVKETTNGNMLKVFMVVTGSMELYRHEMETTSIDIENQSFDYIQKENVYYIGVEENAKIHKITRFNYKKILKNKLAGNSKLAEKIGSKGYRYNDLEKILNEHNC